MPWTGEQRRAALKKKYADNKTLGICPKCKSRPSLEGLASCEPCRQTVLRYNRSPRYRQLSKERFGRVKDAAFNAYGGYVCACCGEQEKTFLELDHIANDGSKHRIGKRRAKGYDLYLWVRRENYPPGFQVLCSSCNQGKHRNGGICPHQSRDYQLRFIGACG